jgi:hypothetical protein
LDISLTSQKVLAKALSYCTLVIHALSPKYTMASMCNLIACLAWECCDTPALYPLFTNTSFADLITLTYYYIFLATTSKNTYRHLCRDEYNDYMDYQFQNSVHEAKEAWIATAHHILDHFQTALSSVHTQSPRMLTLRAPLLEDRVKGLEPVTQIILYTLLSEYLPPKADPRGAFTFDYHEIGLVSSQTEGTDDALRILYIPQPASSTDKPTTKAIRRTMASIQFRIRGTTDGTKLLLRNNSQSTIAPSNTDTDPEIEETDAEEDPDFSSMGDGTWVNDGGDQLWLPTDAAQRQK